MTIPHELRRRIGRHNRHAVAGSFLCALGAAATWLVAYGILGSITLGLATIIQGQAAIEGEKLVSLPLGSSPDAVQPRSSFSSGKPSTNSNGVSARSMTDRSSAPISSKKSSFSHPASPSASPATSAR